MNIPNILTVLRIVLSVPLFVCCALSYWELALLFFIAASITDFIDGWWARKFKQITIFGRIMDPFADKFLICGTFICLLGVSFPNVDTTSPFSSLVSLQPWMVVVIIARELLITSLRAVIEQHGGDFSAKLVGKWKMGLQCMAVIICFVFLSLVEHRTMWERNGFYVSNVLTIYTYIAWLILLWGTVLITLYSGISYSVRAAKVIAGTGSMK